MDRTDRQANLNASASALMWLWGFLSLFTAVALGFPALAINGNILPIALFGAWGVLHCCAAFALRGRRWGVRWWAAALCLLSIASLFWMPRMMITLLGAAINGGALILILCSWKETAGSGTSAKSAGTASPQPAPSRAASL